MSDLIEIVDRLYELVHAEVKHDSRLHEGLNHCEGCERADLARWAKQLIDTEDDISIQKKLQVIDERGQRIVQNMSRKEFSEQQVAKHWANHKARAEERAQKERGP